VSLDGAPQVSYRGGDYGQYRIHHAQKLGASWRIQPLATGNPEDYASTLRTDPYGVTHIAMSGNSGPGTRARVFHARSLDRGYTWSLPTLVSGPYSAAGPVLGIDWNGNVHLAWQETTGSLYRGRIFHSTDRGGPWLHQAVTGTDEHFRPSLVQDGSGSSHIFYTRSTYDGTFHNEVYYVSDRAPTVTVSMVPLGSTSVPRGGTLPLEITVTNETSSAATVDFWMTGILAATGNERLLPSSVLDFRHPIRGRVPAGATFTRTVTLRIPPTAPARLFLLTASVGDRAAGTYADRASLAVRVVP
jgi:hypothetical protein